MAGIRQTILLHFLTENSEIDCLCVPYLKNGLEAAQRRLFKDRRLKSLTLVGAKLIHLPDWHSLRSEFLLLLPG
jgi:hypothetical protein